MVNKYIIIGRVGNKQEIRYLKNDTAVLKFSVATNNVFGGQEETTWHTVQTWGKTAEACNKFLGVGDKCYVEGQLRKNIWTDKEGGKHEQVYNNAERVLFLSDKRVGEDTGDDDECPF